MSNLVKYSSMFMKKTGWLVFPLFAVSFTIGHKMNRLNAESLAGMRNKTQLFGGRELPAGEVAWK